MFWYRARTAERTRFLPTVYTLTVPATLTGPNISKQVDHLPTGWIETSRASLH
jgi:hypothetical protein